VERLASDKKTNRADVEREFFTTMRPTSLLRRFARPEEVAALVTFILQPSRVGDKQGGFAGRRRDRPVDRLRWTVKTGSAIQFRVELVLTILN
jgi:NAD(P)-dependent dehydrogenase (short-subunit alcohol dehydrogenase family)